MASVITGAFTKTTPEGCGPVRESIGLQCERRRDSQPLAPSPEKIRGFDCTELASIQTESEIHQLIAIVMAASTTMAIATTCAIKKIEL